MDHAHVERIVRELLVELGEDPSRPGLRATPARVADTFGMFALRQPEHPAVTMMDEAADGSGMILVENISFVSICEHHLLPFFGRVHIGWIPRERSCSRAYCTQVVDFFAHRPQLQERLTEQIADALVEALEPEGLGVAAEGRHMCMLMRGVEKQNSEIQSSTLRGSFADPSNRRSFFSHVIGAPA